MKQSRYIKPNYALCFGNEDVVFLSVKLLVTETPIAGQAAPFTLNHHCNYSVEVEECLLSPEMEFAKHLIERLCPSCSEDVVVKLMEDIKKLLIEDVSQDLHAIFYQGEVLA